MSTINVLNMSGAVVGTVELSDAIFGIEPNAAVVQLNSTDLNAGHVQNFDSRHLLKHSFP